MIKITKKVKLLSASQPVFVDYWLIHGRIYNSEKTRYYPFKFVLAMDLELDLWDPETESEIPYSDGLESLIDGFICDAGDGFNNDKIRARFFEDCNETIARWNNSRAA